MNAHQDETSTEIVRRGADFNANAEFLREEPSVSDDMATESVGKIILDRMHGRWYLAIILAVIMAPVFSITGYLYAPVKFKAIGVLAVQSRLNPLVDNTPETEDIRLAEFVSEQAQLVKNPVVLFEALRDEQVSVLLPENPGLKTALFSNNLKVYNPRSSPLVVVEFDWDDPRVSAKVVNAIVSAYLELYAPDAAVEFTSKTGEIQRLLDKSGRLIASLEERKLALSLSIPFGVSDSNLYQRDLFEQMMTAEARSEEVNLRIKGIREFVAQRAETQAREESREVTEADLEPQDDDHLLPTVEQLAFDDPQLPSLQAEVQRLQIGLEAMGRRLLPNHQEHRRELASLSTKEVVFEQRYEASLARWYAMFGSDMKYGALVKDRSELQAELDEIRGQDTESRKLLVQVEDIELQLSDERERAAMYQSRLSGLEREQGVIQRGRVFNRAPAVPAIAPSSDKRVMATMGGIAGGIFLAFGGVFLLGTIDMRAMSVRQLAEKNNALRVLGVMPDMDHVEQDSDLVNMAMNCIHRLRSKIEMKRAPEKGYALMVSSPFQGDGKTTLTVSLGWSYAESGYRTLLIDTDFVGRAMTHQFGRLRESGLREVLRNGRVDGQLVELGHPNLSLLGVGFDRRVSAANLNPRLMSRVIDSFRDDFDIILVDTGPLTASLEFAPVAMACDGAVLTIRHGRSRARLTECIEEIRNVGSDYLGVVLNYANRGDCLRYGSSSKMSASAQQSLEELESAAGDENIPSSMDSMFGKFASKSDGND